MSEAALTIIEVPLVRPSGVSPRQWRHALLLPRAVTGYEAALAAGYAPSSARKAARRLADSLGTQRALAEISKVERGKLDSARAIRSSALSALSSRITEDASDNLILGAVKVTTDAVAAGVDDDTQGVTDADVEDTKAYMRRFATEIIKAAFAAGASHNMDVPPTLPLQLIDNIAVRCETPEFTEYTLSDAGRANE